MKQVKLENKIILVTGVAGFIGSNLVKRLLTENENIKVIGIDNMNNYYDVNLKNARLAELNTYESFTFVKGNIADRELMIEIFLIFNYYMSILLVEVNLELISLLFNIIMII